MTKTKVLALALGVVLLGGCAKESSRTVEIAQVKSAAVAYNGVKMSVSVGRFNNQSTFGNGIFANGEDRLGSQAQTILVSSLQESGRFSVLDRTNMSALAQESKLSKSTLNLKGAKYIITGDVVEFGRKTSGDKQLFGILGHGKTQIAHSKVTLNLIKVATGEVVTSASGAGEYALSEREILGFGSSAGYDSTLNGKVLSLSIREAVDNLVMKVENGGLLK
ncbi:MAG: CsgG/HfaB family protein [Campylobacter sp.]|nr:CsgG/HfaB family protein [Campylobacter sp.]